MNNLSRETSGSAARIQEQKIIAETQRAVKDIKACLAGYYYRQYQTGEELPALLIAFIAGKVNEAAQKLCDLSHIIGN